jgi:hypothetical protein
LLAAAALAALTAGGARSQDTLAVGVAAAAPEPEVWLGGWIEVTQGVQNPAQSVGLVGGRATWVRVYLSSDITVPLTVRGRLRVRSAGRLDTLPSAGVAALVPGDGLMGRDRIDRTLNFFLPPDLTGTGSMWLEVVELSDAATGAPVACRDCAGAVKEIVFGPPAVLRLKVIGFRYTKGRLLEPREADYRALHSWLLRAFPLSAVQMDTVTIDALDSTPTCDEINVQLARIRSLDLEGGQDPRVHYYGMVRDAGRFQRGYFMRGCSLGIPDGPDASVVSSGSAGVPFKDQPLFSWDRDGSYADWNGAHELAHTLGRRHPGWCRRQERDVPLAERNDGGHIGMPEEDNQGLDPISLELFGRERWHDVMTYCPRQWVSARTYTAILERLLQEDSVSRAAGLEEPEDPAGTFLDGTPAGADSVLHVVVKFSDLARNYGKIMGIFAVAVRGRPAALDRAVLDTISPGRRVTIELDDGRGKVRYPAWIMVNRPEVHEDEIGQDSAQQATPEGVGFVNAFVPNLPGAGRVRVFRSDGLVASVGRSASAPMLERMSHVLLSVDGVVVAHEFEWETSDPDEPGPTNTTYVQLALDGGSRWDTIQQTRDRRFQMGCDLLRKHGSIRLRFVASDGVNHRVVYESRDLVPAANDPCSPGEPSSRER